MQLLQILQEWPGALPFVIVAAHIEHELDVGILVDSVENNSDRKLSTPAVKICSSASNRYPSWRCLKLL